MSSSNENTPLPDGVPSVAAPHGLSGTRSAAASEKVEQAKNEFVTLGSHQLRTPISAIAWFSEMLLAGDAGELNDDQRDYIQRIYVSNQRLAKMVDDMLIIASLALDDIAINPEKVDLPTLVHVVLATQMKKHPQCADRHVHETHGPDLNSLELDPKLMTIAIGNLISNALKYTPSGGTIAISTTRSPEKLTADSQGSIAIRVTDSGFGIPQIQQKHIFAKLFRASNIKKKDTDGTGLGLYIVRAIMNMVGGRIDFESEENKGSTFALLLPLEGMKPRPGSQLIVSDAPSKEAANV